MQSALAGVAAALAGAVAGGGAHYLGTAKQLAGTRADGQWCGYVRCRS